jgi:SAM-dependent methyltransferase
MQTPDGITIAGMLLEPSRFLMEFSSALAASSGGKPILDVACGSGRNALPLAELGCQVICIDKDLAQIEVLRDALKDTPLSQLSARLVPQSIDLQIAAQWHFGQSTVGGIINIHCLALELIPLFYSALIPGGYLLIESVPAHGGNYRQLPKSGELRSALAGRFELEAYKENRAGPRDVDAVTVKVFARKISSDQRARA